ncbi:MAG: flavodoxin-dependent (E)-4-hydroxy-3-methylbut-2-enyl-diphosphate synthase, partial [Desulfobacteraceae bacterium]
MVTTRTNRRTRQIYVGDVPIGGGAPVVVQSMTNTDTRDVSSTVRQIQQLYEAGCEIVRLAVPDMGAVEGFKEIRSRVSPPLIADVHFDHRLAIAALKAGAHALRINPGNIGGRKAVEKVIKEADARDIPIRIGVNAGSLPKRILKKHGEP